MVAISVIGVWRQMNPSSPAVRDCRNLGDNWTMFTTTTVNAVSDIRIKSAHLFSLDVPLPNEKRSIFERDGGSSILNQTNN
jgi:hypothetical protein